MTPWRHLLQSAIAGTQRRPLRADLAQQLGLQDDVPFWDVAAATHLLEKAARVEEAVFPAAADAFSGEEAPVCNDGATAMLEAILYRGQAPAAPEWLTLARHHGVSPPPEHLPALLDRLTVTPEWMGLLGPRAVWLAQFRPKWIKALELAAVKTDAFALLNPKEMDALLLIDPFGEDGRAAWQGLAYRGHPEILLQNDQLTAAPLLSGARRANELKQVLHFRLQMWSAFSASKEGK